MCLQRYVSLGLKARCLRVQVMQLYAIVVGKMEPHPYWREGAFVALGNNAWGPSPTLRMVDVPEVFLTAEEAQSVIDQHNYSDVKLEVATFVMRKRRASTFKRKQ